MEIEDVRDAFAVLYHVVNLTQLFKTIAMILSDDLVRWWLFFFFFAYVRLGWVLNGWSEWIGCVEQRAWKEDKLLHFHLAKPANLAVKSNCLLWSPTCYSYLQNCDLRCNLGHRWLVGSDTKKSKSRVQCWIQNAVKFSSWEQSWVLLLNLLRFSILSFEFVA